MKPLPVPLPLYAAAIALLVANAPLEAETIVWRTDRTTGSMTSTSNYYIEGTTTPPSPSGFSGTLVFDGPSPVNPYNNSAFTFDRLVIKGGSSQFNLTGSSHFILREGIDIASGVNASIQVGVRRHNTVGTNLQFNVATGGSLSLTNFSMGANTGTQGAFSKTGGGTLIVNSGITGGTATKLFFEEGTIELRNGAEVSLGTSPSFAVHLGKAGESAALLRGEGAINAVLATAGMHYATLDASAGTLQLAHVDATLGATLRFDLDSFDTFTGTTFTGENLYFDFSGGMAGEAYTLLDFGSADIDFDSITFNPNYTLDLGFGTDGWLLDDGKLQVQFAAIPEPTSLSLLAATAVAAAFITRRKQGAQLS